MKNVKTNRGDNIDIVKRTFSFAVRTVRLCRELDERRTAAKALINQLIRSGTSVGANIEEAQAAQSKIEFAHVCNIALKEARETNYWLRLLIASDIVSQAKLSPLLSESGELCRVIGAITKNSRRNITA